MSRALNWTRFCAAILGALIELARELHRRHNGDVDAARTELRHMRDHGVRLDAAEAAIDAQIEAARKREGSS